MRLLNAGLSMLLAVAPLVAADAPYAGKWKLDIAKSDLGSTTSTYAQLPSGEMQATSDGQSYKFRLDGKDYPDPFGDTAAWTSIDASTWKTVWKLNGKVIATDNLKVSADGKTLTIETTGTKPNGEKMDDKSILQRVAGTQGLAGTWKMQKYTPSGPEIFELTPSAGNGLKFQMIDMQMTCDAKVDGKDYPCIGPTMGTGWTIAYTSKNPRELGLTVKKDGKPLYQYLYTVSTDGKTMTATGGATATTEKVKYVYEKM